MLREDVADYLKRMKNEPIIPFRSQNNALILYNSTDSIRGRIVEVTNDEDSTNTDEQDAQPTIELSSSASSPTSDDAEIRDVNEEENMEID